MGTFFYLIRTMLAMFVFSFSINKIGNKIIRIIWLLFGGIFFGGVFVWILAMA